MAFCAVCGKGPRSGNNVSHANNRTKRVWRPNLQPARIVTENGTHKRVRVCTSCISAGKIRIVRQVPLTRYGHPLHGLGAGQLANLLAEQAIFLVSRA